MFYTYVLYSLKSKRLYIGSTADLKQRFDEHNKGIGGSYTSKNIPFKLVHYEAFLSKKDAIKQERFYKTGYGREVLKEKIKESLDIICPVV
ncbi:GIY-YIG nuclease family protein [Candidatus Roizmanbacteria bacterium]|nr:GIY-YIG nuclease family protein [Candidatus Roizmanbacteria bacterium]